MPLRLAVVSLVLLASSVAAPPAVAAAPSLRVTRAIADFERRAIVVDVRCAGSRAACRGWLTATVLEEPVTRRRRVALVPGQTRRVALAVRPTELRKRRWTNGADDEVVLRTRARTLVAGAFLEPRATCRTPGVTVAESELSRVLELDGFGLFACTRAGGRLLRLTAEGHLWSVDAPRPAIAGRYAAFASQSGSSQCTSHRVTVVDVVSRRVVRERSSLQYEPAIDACSGPPIHTLVLRPSGAVAWIEGDEHRPGPFRLRAADAAGTRTLAEGPAIDPRSLTALDATRLGWTDAGRAVAAPFG